MTRPDTAALAAWSDQLAGLAEYASASVVAVHLGRHESVSGTLWRPNAIVTAAHALRRSHDIRLTLPDASSAQASLAGADGSTDLAVLRIDGTNPVPIESRDAAAVKTGHWVMAVARNAEGAVTVDQGLIGRVGGAWQTWRGGRIDRLLRLDGALSASFAGAPIIAADGFAIGVGTPALARGFGIVVPTSTVNRVVDELLAKGRITRGYFGIGTQPVALPTALVNQLELDDGHGLLITSIAEDSPAAAAGLLIGDVLLDIDGHRVRDIDDLHAALGGDRVGRSITAAIVRAGARMEKSVTVGERPRMHC
jgi:S1-C subfamily serine protease